MASIVAPSVSPSRSTFERTMDKVNIPKQDVNSLVMDFLIQEGYPAAAARFAEEANLDIGDDHGAIEERVKIRDAIFRGDLQAAIEEINDVDAQLLDNNKPLHFALLRLQLIELIKAMFDGDDSQKQQLFTAAVTFAQQNLAPYTPQSDKFRSDLERAMALLIVPREAWQPKAKTPSQTRGEQFGAFGPLEDLVDPGLKAQVAADVNAALLESQGKPPSTGIHKILQTRAWAENLAKDKNVTLPDMSINLWDAPADSQNGDTQMTDDVDEGVSTDVVQRYTNLHESAR